MNLTFKNDVLKVLTTTKPFVEAPKHVQFDYQALDELSEKVKTRIDATLPERDEEFFSLGDYEKDVQVVFLENVVNFCFWSEEGKEKWKVEYNGAEDDGASALRLVFERAIGEGVPILDAEYLSRLTIDQVRDIFRPSNGAEIPLIEKRHENLVEAGKVLLKKYDGYYSNLLKDSNYDAILITRATIENFKSFNDSYKGVNFYKRAQLNAFDIAQILSDNKITNTESLTAMADYKLPQLLRFMGVLKYSDELASKVDNWELIESGSIEEIEIRSATIWATELISQELRISAGLADRAIWWLSCELDIEQPYHRTYSIYY
ncbi:MAG: queuosine salvage family protein [Patescibacteria group bacterium]|nr:queuosine salvage family protein [Patescibacteria group bacterium]